MGEATLVMEFKRETPFGFFDTDWLDEMSRDLTFDMMHYGHARLDQVIQVIKKVIKLYDFLYAGTCMGVLQRHRAGLAKRRARRLVRQLPSEFEKTRDNIESFLVIPLSDYTNFEL